MDPFKKKIVDGAKTTFRTNKKSKITKGKY